MRNLRNIALALALFATPAQTQTIFTSPPLGLPLASGNITCTAAGVCTVGGALAGTSIAIQDTIAGGVLSSITNTTSGATAFSSETIIAGSTTVAIYSLSQGFGSSAQYIAASGLIDSNGAAGLNYSASNATGLHRWWANGVQIMSLATAGGLTLPGLTVAAGTPSSICQNAGTKEITVNAALTCTVSAADAKHDIQLVTSSASDMIRALQPVSFIYNDSDRARWGFIAEQVASVDKRFGDAWSASGPRSIDQNAILAATVKAMQEVLAANDNLSARLQALEAKAAR